MVGIIELALFGIIPVVVSVLLFLLKEKTRFGRLSYSVQQIIYGIIFGIIAVLGTELGVNVNGATMNARDAAPVAAGLIFGAPAGIIAGVIGGVHRYVAVYWGAGAYTQLACSISTFLAGVIAAATRKTVFENRRCKWYYAWAVGFFAEVIHMVMIFVTNRSDVERAFSVVEVCTFPMVLVNSVAVLLSMLIVNYIGIKIGKDEIRRIKKGDKLPLSTIIQRWLFGIVVFCFVGSNGFTFLLQQRISIQSCKSLLELNLNDAKSEVTVSADKILLELAHKVADEIDLGEYDSLKKLASKYNVTEINIIDNDGVIVNSSYDRYIGFVIYAGEQGREFRCLSEGKTEFVQTYQKISFDDETYRKYAGVTLKSMEGYVQIGCDASNFQVYIEDDLSAVSTYRHIGSDGFMVVLDANNKVISSPLGDVGTTMSGLDGDDQEAYQENEIFKLKVGEEDYYCMYLESEGYTIVALRPTSEVEFSRNLTLYVQSFLEVEIFGILFVLLYSLVNNTVINKVKSVTLSLDKIASGNLNEKINVLGSYEFEGLSHDINATVNTLKEYIAKEASRIDSDLQFAKTIQHSTLPSIFPAFPSMQDIFDIHATMDTAKEVGGDFYDFYFTYNETLIILIADVSGKGIPAAMFMMTAKTLIKSFCEAGLSIEEVMTRVNKELCANNEAGMFVTTWLGFFDIKTGHLEFINAGHNPPVIMRNGTYEFLKSKVGLVLAGMDGVKYKKQELDLLPGEELFLYTDGVTEATNAKNELFSEPRLLETLNKSKLETSKEVCLEVKRAVDEFVGDAPQFDDITMLSLKYFGSATTFELSIDAITKNVDVVADFVDEKLESLDCDMKTINQMNIAIDEIFSNIVKFAYPEGTIGKATIRISYSNNIVHLSFIDGGKQFNPLAHTDPDTSLSVEERGIGGLGILMVKKMMDDVTYKYMNDKNVLTLVKKIK